MIAGPRCGFPSTSRRCACTGSQLRPAPTPRVYTIRDETGKRHRAYRLVVSKGVVGEYYGVQGMSWKDPPILDNPDAVRIVNGRKLLIYRDGSPAADRRLADPKQAVYWVSNTLTQALSHRPDARDRQLAARAQAASPPRSGGPLVG